MAEALPVDLPYRAEYAKTARGSCKLCKSGVDKAELKLAVMVQSRFHDGKDANWFHVACFFSKQRPKSVGDFAHFEQLRWEDQEMIKKKIANGGAAAGPGKVSTKEVLSDYEIGYAKSGGSKCQACEEKIPKKGIRISKKDYESERALMFSNGGGLDRWHHLDCFMKIREQLEFFVAGKLIPGFKDLDKEDKAEVEKKLPEIKPSASSKASSSKAAPAAASNGKRKLEDESDGKAAKKSKKDAGDPIEELMKKQNKQMYAYRDVLKDWKKSDLQHILSSNKQEIPSGPDKILDRIADIMTFGTLKPCTRCNKGQYVFRSGVGYQCLGYLSEYTKCMNITQEPERVPFKVPNDYREIPPFNKYKFKAQKRAIKHIAPVEALQKEVEKKKPKLIKSPLKNFKFMIVGVDKKTEQKWIKKIEEFKGEIIDYKKTKSTKIAAIITTEDEVKTKKLSEIKWAEKKKIPVVKGDFVEAVTELNYELVNEIKKNLICDWVSDVPGWLKKINTTFEERGEKKVKEEYEKKEKSVKLIMKGGAVVDPESGVEDIGHVYKEGKSYYNCVLNRTSIEDGKNSYYKMQIIESDRGKSYWLFKAWGRIGTTIGGTKLDEDISLGDAIELFKEKYGELTGNEWGEHFNKRPGLYIRSDIDYGEKQQMQKIVPSTQTSKLAMSVQELVSLIFDVDRMKQAMLEFEINLEEMPLGKISRKQVLTAYGILSEASGLIEKLGKSEDELASQMKRQLLDASNRFYSLIPHNFGTRTPPLLDNDPLVKAKLDMLENLLEIELAYEMLLEGDKGGDASVESHYKTLNAAIDPVEAGSEEFSMLEKYMKNTHGHTHGYSLDVEHIFKVNRKGENKRYRPFKELHNRKLLWHGSRITNYAGILSQGLRIAPPEAPVTGYMFGKGVYFADMVTKSANYCHASRDNTTGLLLVCEVALGDMHELKAAKDSLTKAPKNCHSVKGLGQTEPDPTEKVVLPDGVEVPAGKPVKSKVANSSLLYNEYIVYDTAQINIRYLMRVNFNFSGRR